MMIDIFAKLLFFFKKETIKNKLTILIYHDILETPNKIHTCIDKISLEKHFSVLSKYLNVLSLEEAYQHLIANTLPDNAVTITFDDGYADNVSVALPLLLKYRLKATFFIVPGYFDGGMMFNDKIKQAINHLPDGTYDIDKLDGCTVKLDNIKSRMSAVSEIISKIKYLDYDERNHIADLLLAKSGISADDIRLMVDTNQLKQLYDAGMSIGVHTMTHPILAKISPEDAEYEIVTAKEILSDLLKTTIDLFSYPNGTPDKDYTQEHVEILKRNKFKLALSTINGVATPDSNLYELPRYAPWQNNRYRFLFDLIQSRVTPIKG